MKSTSMMTKTRGTAALAVAALCIFFAGTAKADCSQVMRPRTMAPAAIGDSLIGKVQPNARAVSDIEDANMKAEAKALGGNTVVGLWLTTVFAQGQVIDQAFEAFTGDGVEILNDTAAPVTGNVCLGAWVKVAPNAYVIKHPSWTFDAAGNVSGMAIIRTSITVDATGMTFKGTYTVEILSLAGNPLDHFGGTLTGTRITVD